MTRAHLESLTWTLYALVCAPYVVLRLRRYHLLRNLEADEMDARQDLAFKTTPDGYNTRAIWDSARKRLRRAERAPLWRWTP